MTVVVADTSPLNYLVLIGQIGVLRRLYGRVLVPPEVLAELADSGAPPEVAGWIQSRPEWLEVRSVRRGQDEPNLPQLDPGERAAILLAQEEPDALLLIDDAAGRAEANRRDIPNTGTLGVLRAAAMRQLLDLAPALTRLAATNFRVSQALLEDLLAEDSERNRHIDGWSATCRSDPESSSSQDTAFWRPALGQCCVECDFPQRDLGPATVGISVSECAVNRPERPRRARRIIARTPARGIRSRQPDPPRARTSRPRSSSAGRPTRARSRQSVCGRESVVRSADGSIRIRL